LVILSDEIYDRLVYGVEHVCFSSLPGMRERTILLSGFSKTYAMTGWRLGYAAAPAEILAGMQKAHQYITMCAPTTAQIAGIEALQHGEDAVQEMLREYDQRRRVIVDGLNTIGLPCVEPKGAFYAFPSIESTSLSSEDFSEELLYDQKVAVVPGTAFGECGEGFVRCAYATSLVQIEEALGRMEDFAKKRRK
jgi:aminotransferase